jgi:hypothetical protein
MIAVPKTDLKWRNLSLKWCISLLAGLLAVGAIQTQTIPEGEKKEGFLSMFNGKAFTG